MKDSKEIRFAKLMVEGELLNFENKYIQYNIEEHQLTNDFKGFSKTNFKLPKGKTWRWNKSLSVKNIQLNNSTKLSYDKMNSRSKVKNSYFPKYKIWLFKIEKEYSYPLYFIWCENVEIELNIADYSFLSPFVSESLAKELNWI